MVQASQFLKTRTSDGAVFVLGLGVGGEVAFQVKHWNTRNGNQTTKEKRQHIWTVEALDMIRAWQKIFRTQPLHFSTRMRDVMSPHVCNRFHNQSLRNFYPARSFQEKQKLFSLFLYDTFHSNVKIKVSTCERIAAAEASHPTHVPRELRKHRYFAQAHSCISIGLQGAISCSACTRICRAAPTCLETQ